MRRLVLYLCLVCLVSSCRKRYHGTADMKGVLMHTCGENVPLANQKIALIIQGAEVLSTTTNASGYFHIKGDYSEWGDDRSDGKSLVIVNQGPGFGDFDLLLNPPDKFNDTIYKYNSTISVVHIQMDTSIYGSTEDTLIIWNTLPEVGGPIERYEYLGPFMNCLLYTSPSPRDLSTSRMPSSA